jgi:Flp pilus assembly pilin Flp
MRHTGFWRDDSGQDMVEYTLLLAVVCLLSAGLILDSSGAIGGLWGRTTSSLSAASTAASS